MNQSTIIFKHTAYTSPDQNVRLIGNLAQLGNWTPNHAIQFVTDVHSYPDWTN